MRKAILLIFLIFILTLLCVHASIFDIDAKDKPNEQVSKGNKVYVPIRTERPRVVFSSGGITDNLLYDFVKKEGDWQVDICHKDYKINYELSSVVDKAKYDSISIVSQKGIFSKLPKSVSMDQECNSFVMSGKKGDAFKIGDESVVIEISDDNVTFGVIPEYKSCSYLFCESEIILENSNGYNITINSSDLSASVEGTDDSYITFYYFQIDNVTVDDYNCTGCPPDLNCTLVGNHTELRDASRTANINEGLDITILSNQSKIFTLHSIMSQPESKFKYNVSIIYLGVEYVIDPYFNTTNSSFNNGVYNNTFLNESGFVQLNATYGVGDYVSEVFNAGGNAVWNNISWTKDYCYGCSNITFYADYDTDVNGTWGKGSLVGVATGGANVSNGKLDLTYDDRRYVTYDAVDNADSQQTGCIRFKIIPNYSGSPSSAQFFFAISHSSDYNLMTFYHWDDGTTYLLIKSETGTNIVFEGMGVWDPVAGQEYEFELNYDLTLGATRIFFDGVQLGSTQTGTGTRSDLIVNLKVGTSFNNAYDSNFKIDDLVIFDKVQHTSNYDVPSVLMSYLNLSVQNCSSFDCSDGAWLDTNDTSPQDLNLTSQYFQYKFKFKTDNVDYTPQLYNVTIDYNLLSLYINITNLTYHSKIGENQSNLFTWHTSSNSNTSVRVWNTNLSYDVIVSNETLTGSHSINSDILTSIGTYNFTVTSCNTFNCSSENGSFDVININLDYDLNNTNYMREESISSTVWYDELRINYTEYFNLTSGNVIECYLKYPNATVARAKVNMFDLGDGWYNYSGFYTFPIDAIVGTYVLSCENLNRSFIKTQNIELYDSGTCNVTDVTVQSPCNSTCNVSFTLVSPNSSTVAITQLEWVLVYPSGATFDVVNSSLLLSGLSTSPSGITHSFMMNSETELGRTIYPGVRMKMWVGSSNKISNYFLVDNLPVLTAQDVWSFNGRYINGEII